MPLGTEIGLSLGDCVRWGFICPFPKGAHPPIFGNARCGQTVVGLRCYLLMNGMEVGLSPGDFVLDGDPVPFPQKWAEPFPPQFSAHFYCGQTAACIKMPLGIELWPPPRRLCVTW